MSNVNQTLYGDPVTFGIIEEARDMEQPKKFRLNSNAHFTFGKGRIQRTEKNTEIGTVISDVSAYWVLEELFERGLLFAFVTGFDAQK